MAVLKITSLLLICSGILGWAATQRGLYLSLLLWFFPIYSMAFSTNANINGLIVLIGMLFSAQTIYSLNNVRLWNIDTRKKGKIFTVASCIVNTVISFYFAVQGYALGYMPFFSIFGKYGIYAALLWGCVCSVCACSVFISTVDKYFSKKSKFILIKCSPCRGRLQHYRDRFHGI